MCFQKSFRVSESLSFSRWGPGSFPGRAAQVCLGGAGNQVGRGRRRCAALRGAQGIPRTAVFRAPQAHGEGPAPRGGGGGRVMGVRRVRRTGRRRGGVPSRTKLCPECADCVGSC